MIWLLIALSHLLDLDWDFKVVQKCDLRLAEYLYIYSKTHNNAMHPLCDSAKIDQIMSILKEN